MKNFPQRYVLEVRTINLNNKQQRHVLEVRTIKLNNKKQRFVMEVRTTTLNDYQQRLVMEIGAIVWTGMKMFEHCMLKNVKVGLPIFPVY